MPSIALISLPLTQAAASCSGLRRAARELPPRVLIVDSQAAKFFEANFVTGTEPLQPWYGVDITGWHTVCRVAPCNAHLQAKCMRLERRTGAATRKASGRLELQYRRMMETSLYRPTRCWQQTRSQLSFRA
jgi:hypothetical protein